MKKIVWLLLVTAVCLLTTSNTFAQTESETQPIVQAVLFYSPTCPHCHKVITEDLPPLNEQYGDRLQILGVDVTQEVGQQLYQNAIAQFDITEERLGVPTMIIGETVLVGSLEIPQLFPDLVADGMAAGGVGWPEIPGLFEAVPDLPPSAVPNVDEVVEVVDVLTGTAVPMPTTTAPAEIAIAPILATDTAVPLEEIDTALLAAETVPPADPVGFAIAWALILFMLVTLLYVFIRLPQLQASLSHSATNRVPPVRSVSIPLLIFVGVVVAAYLTYVDVTQVNVVCGPVGHCDLVQASPYARILGIPVAVLGLVNYLLLGALWLWQRADWRQPLPVLSLLMLPVLGTFFSVYLTLLEVIVIRAVCAWCLTSALATTLLTVLIVKFITNDFRHVQAVTNVTNHTV